MDQDFITAAANMKNLASASRAFAADPVAVLDLLRGPGGVEAAENLCRNIRQLADSLDEAVNVAINQRETIGGLIVKLHGGAQ